MLKNNNGVTISTLLITIVVMIILTGVSMTSGISTIREIRAGRIISNMTLIKAKVETIYEEYQFSNDETVLVGEKTGDIPVISKTENNKFSEEYGKEASEMTWYKWDGDVLQNQGLDPNMATEGNCFYVNYENAEILYSAGTSIDGKTSYYSLTGLKYTLGND